VKYVLTAWVIGAKKRVEITPERYEALVSASAIQVAAMNVEEKFELVITNFEEFEAELATLAVRFMIRRNLPWIRMSADRLLLNRRLANLLSTCRLYVDQVRHDLGRAPMEVEAIAIDQFFTAQYDASLGYRVMESLRNLLQHRSIPVTGITYSSRLDDRLSVFSIDLKLDLTALGEGGFKARVLRELEALPEARVDLLLFVRQYVEGLSRAHAAVRDHIRALVKQADDTMGRAIADWQADGSDMAGLSAARELADRTMDGQVWITANLRARRDELATANQSLIALSRRYISSARPRDAYGFGPDVPDENPAT
jgi:hypothetical protein